MNNSRIFLSLAEKSGFEDEYISKALHNNWITSGGPNVDDFESELQKYFDERLFVAALNSGTSAIHLALILLGIKKDDEVICQSMTFAASANPILYQGAVPIFVDSEPETWNICPQNLEIAISDRLKLGKKPKAIIAVHLYGNPYKVNEINEIANHFNIPVIEDSAEAFGSMYKGKKCGSFGSLGVLSFNGNKILTTSSGGAIIVNSKKMKEKAIFYATQSKDDAPHFHHSEIGYNYRMSNICAGVGLGQMRILDQNVKNKLENHKFYKNIFDNIEDVDLFEVVNEDFTPNHWLNTILIKQQIKNDKNRESLKLALEKNNIESRPLWKPMHLQPLFEKYPYYGNNVAQKLFENGLCLPSGANLGDDEKKRIKIVIQNFFK